LGRGCVRSFARLRVDKRWHFLSTLKRRPPLFSRSCFYCVGHIGPTLSGCCAKQPLLRPSPLRSVSKKLDPSRPRLPFRYRWIAERRRASYPAGSPAPPFLTTVGPGNVRWRDQDSAAPGLFFGLLRSSLAFSPPTRSPSPPSQLRVFPVSSSVSLSIGGLIPRHHSLGCADFIFLI